MAARMTLVILGDDGVGKTALTIQLCLNHFVEAYDPTIEDLYEKRVTIDGQLCMLKVLDTAGREEYTALRSENIRDGDGFVLVYSTSSRSSFTRIQKYHCQIQQARGSMASSPSPSHPPVSGAGLARTVPVMLVGNKSDRVTEREVSTPEGHALARELGCEFVEASAKNCVNVEKAFYDVVRLLRPQRQQSVRQPPSRTGTGIRSSENRQDPAQTCRPRAGKKCVII